MGPAFDVWGTAAPLTGSDNIWPPAVDTVDSTRQAVGRPDTPMVRVTDRQPWRSAGILRLGLSRHSALGVAKSLSTTRPMSVTMQAAALLTGSGLIGVAVALLVEARLGLAPYDVLSSGLSNRTGISLGQAGWTVAAVLFGVASLLGRRPSAWGLAFVFLNGLAIDAASEILRHPDSMALRLIFVPAGIFTMAAGITLVVRSGTTGGPFELLVSAGKDRGVNPVVVRCALDLGVLSLGLVLGGAFGPATVVYGVFMGVSIVTMSQAADDHSHGRARRSSDEVETRAPVDHPSPTDAADGQTEVPMPTA